MELVVLGGGSGGGGFRREEIVGDEVFEGGVMKGIGDDDVRELMS